MHRIRRRATEGGAEASFAANLVPREQALGTRLICLSIDPFDFAPALTLHSGFK